MSFTLYPAHSRVGRGNLVYDTPFFPLSAEFWRYCVLNSSTQRRALPHTRAKKYLSEHFISSSVDRTHNQIRPAPLP